MLRLSALVFLLMSMTASAIFTARLIGSARGSPLSILFTNPDGSDCQHPCIFGIRPGETGIEEATYLLASHPLTRDFSEIAHKPYTVRSQKYDDILIEVDSTPDGVVDTVFVSAGFLKSDATLSISRLLPQPVYFGDVISLYGAPDYVFTDNPGG